MRGNPGYLLLSVLTLELITGCTTLEYPRRWDGGGLRGTDSPDSGRARRAPGKTEVEAEVQDAVAFARSQIGVGPPLTVDGLRFPYDCSGFVMAVFHHAQVPVPTTPQDTPDDDSGATERMYRALHQMGEIFTAEPAPGDLVFFDNTWDKNGNGRWDDPLTHVGLVTEVQADGTVEFVHLGNSGIVASRLNLDWPDMAEDPKSGERLNDPLRRRARAGEPVLGGQLFRAYGRQSRLYRGE